MKNLIIAPSILSADFADLGNALTICKNGGAEWVHVDVMDNHFVPNLTIGPVVVKSLRPRTDLFLDVHLMVTDPGDIIPEFITAGADGITFHLEANMQPLPVLKMIREAGKKAGLSIKPGTPVTALEPFLEHLDLVLIMSVEPGFGGQSFMEDSIEKIAHLKEMLKEKKLEHNVLIEVDGGINFSTGERVIQAGANVLVAGSAVFNSGDPVQTIEKLKKIGLK